MIKKSLALLLAFAMMLSCVTIVASAEYAGENVTIQVTSDKSAVNTGEQFTLTVVLKQAVLKLGNLYLTMDYDESKLEFVSATAGALSNNAEDLEDGNKYVKFVWDTDGDGTDLSAESKVFDVTFAVKTGIASQDNVAPVLTVDDGGFADATDDQFDIPYTINNATVAAIAPHVHAKGVHTPAEAPSCFEAGTLEYWTCTGCDAKLDAEGNVITDITDPATGEHSATGAYITENGKHWKVCDTVGCTVKLEEANCSGGTATCVAKAECAVCGVEYGDKDANNHVGASSTMEADDDYHWGECGACLTQLEKTAHTYEWIIDKEATVYEVGLKHEECSVCEYVRNENTEIEKVIPEMPTATVGTATASSGMPLSVSAKFTAVTPTAEQQYYYNNWYVDFVLTSNVDIPLNKGNYLAGEYGEYGWLKIDNAAGEEGISGIENGIVAGTPLKIVETGMGGMKMKYREIWETVKEFQCGVYLTPEFLLANEDIELTLALNLYDREGKAYKLVEKTYIPEAIALPEATIGEAEVSEEMPLTISTKFTAVEPTEEQQNAYNNWYADFVLTANKDIPLTEGNYLAGEYGTYGWVKIDGEAIEGIVASEPLKIVETGLGGMKMKYREIWETVQEFQCGLFLTPEFLKANADLEIELVLNLYDRSGNVYPIAVFEYLPEEAEEEDDGRERPDEEPTKPTKPSEPTKPSTPAEEETEDVIVVTQSKVDEAEEQQAPVQLEMTPVNPNSLFGGANTISIKLPVNVGKVPVEIPVEDVTPGTVVVIVYEDGTEEVINTSVITEDGIVVELEGEVTIKVVDKSLNFTDVHGVDHWAAKHIDFVTARGLFNGTSAATFSPEDLTTRGQLMTVLARLSGDGADTITDGIAWAVKSGISDGSTPNGFITRQDVAVMMWRFAGNLVSAYDISGYTDAADVASYADIAIAWAVENGILTGYPDGTLMPLANATRAHVATMMERMVNNIK